MAREKIQRKNQVGKLDLEKVRWLQKIQKNRNQELKGTGFFCSLHPNKNKVSCKGCSHYEKCLHYKWERDYLNKEDSKKANKRRKSKQENPKRKVETAYLEDNEQYADFEQNEEDTKFPCGDMNFACPDRETCEGGKNCPWEP